MPADSVLTDAIADAARRAFTQVRAENPADRSRLRNARRLNPATVVQRLADDLQIPEPIGSFTTLGSRAVYQVVALAYAPAGCVLAAGGSGGRCCLGPVTRPGVVGRQAGRRILGRGTVPRRPALCDRRRR
jgi:ferric-dicitrate binding protein FerR (iron transport regulator)